MSMSSAQDGAAGASVTATTRRCNVPLLVRALLLAAVGFTVTFSAPLHENIVFNRALFALLCAGLVILSGVRFFAARRSGSASAADRTSLLLGAIALVAGVATLLTDGLPNFALILIIWAALNAVIELWNGLRAGNRESITVGALSGLLAILLTLGSGDVVAVIGFLGAYGILAGVYLAIAAFDFSPADGVTPARSKPLHTEIAGS